MDFKSKYIKYKLRYLRLKQIAGSPYKIITVETKDFLDGWSELKQYGQQNCGIFINDTDDDQKQKLIKCGSSNMDILLKLKRADPEQTIFPKIHKVYKYDTNHYVEMDRLDGDLTSLLFEKIPQKILQTMDTISKDEMYKLFNNLIPKILKNEINFYPQILSEDDHILNDHEGEDQN